MSGIAQSQDIISGENLIRDEPRNQQQKVFVGEDRFVDELLDEFPSFSEELILRIYEDQNGNFRATRDILLALPPDFEFSMEDEMPTENDLVELPIGATVESCQNKNAKATYKDMLLRENPVPIPQEPVMVTRTETKKIWKPQIMIVKDSKKSAATQNITSMIEDEEELQELNWLVCCEGSRDAAKILGAGRRKAAVSGIHVRSKEMDQKMKRLALKIK